MQPVRIWADDKSNLRLHLSWLIKHAQDGSLALRPVGVKQPMRLGTVLTILKDR